MTPRTPVATAVPHGYRMLHACRWPFTVHPTTWLLVHGAGQLLKQPITVLSEVSLRVSGSATVVSIEQALKCFFHHAPNKMCVFVVEKTCVQVKFTIWTNKAKLNQSVYSLE